MRTISSVEVDAAMLAASVRGASGCGSTGGAGNRRAPGEPTGTSGVRGNGRSPIGPGPVASPSALFICEYSVHVLNLQRQVGLAAASQHHLLAHGLAGIYNRSDYTAVHLQATPAPSRQVAAGLVVGPTKPYCGPPRAWMQNCDTFAPPQIWGGYTSSGGKVGARTSLGGDLQLDLIPQKSGGQSAASQMYNFQGSGTRPSARCKHGGVHTSLWMIPNADSTASVVHQPRSSVGQVHCTTPS